MTPDIATFAKAIASGYPFGAVVGRRDVMDYGVPASGTFNGNPVGVAAALATLEELSQPGVYAGWKPWASSWRTASRPWGRSTAAHSTSATWGVFFVLGFGYTQDLGDFGTGSPRPTWPPTSALWPGARITASASPTAGGGSLHRPHPGGHPPHPGGGRPGFGRDGTGGNLT